ncbi:MAG: transcriptional regulator [Pirellula sp.]|nr:transcriptional regulator [Pirellula sp.]
MTLNLSDAEMEALDALCEQKGLSKTALIRQAIRLYQTVEVRVRRGDKVVFENEVTKEKAELVVI